MHDGKKELPEMYRTVLALLIFENVPPLPLTGFIAETTDTHEKYFHAFNRIGYSTELIAKWDYLDEIAPGFCLSQNGKRDKKQKNANAQMTINYQQPSAGYTCNVRRFFSTIPIREKHQRRQRKSEFNSRFFRF